MRIILTLSCAWSLMPTWPCSLDSSSAMRCSSLETVLWRSETAESVIGAIMWICGQSAGGRYVVIRGRRDGRRGGAQWQVQEMSTRVDSFGVGSLRARLDGCTDSRAAVSPSANDVVRRNWFLATAVTVQDRTAVDECCRTSCTSVYKSKDFIRTRGVVQRMSKSSPGQRGTERCTCEYQARTRRDSVQGIKLAG